MSEHQSGLFDQSPASAGPAPTELALTAQPGRVLTKAQQAFNRLVAKIEKLRAKLDRETRRLDATLGHFAREIHPRLRRQAALRADLVRALAVFIGDKRIIKGRRDRRALHDLLAALLAGLAATEGGLVAEDLRAIYEKLFGESVEAGEAREFAAGRDMMEEMFDEMGVDIDLSDLDPGMDQAEIAARLAGKLGDEDILGGKPAEAAAASAKNKRQLAREAREQAAGELRQKTIGSIYKQLAKVLHPDLERNPAERSRKVALMQELTVAHRAGDLHTLLRLELEWLHREETDASRLTEDKLVVFNTVLREQAQNLEQEIFQLPQHPRYQVLAKEAGPFRSTRWTDSPAELDELDLILADMERSLAALRGPYPLAEVRAVLVMWRGGGLV